MKIIFLNGELAGQEFELKPPGLSVGRETDNDICLSGAAASRYHIKFAWEDDVWQLRDQGSTNGTTLNGHKISGAEKLKGGDEIGVGTARILFDDDRRGIKDVAGPQEVTKAASPPPPPLSPPPVETGEPQGRKGAGFASFMSSLKRKESDSASPDLGKMDIFAKPGAGEDEAAPRPARRSGRLFHIVIVSVAFLLVAWFVIITGALEERDHKRQAADQRPTCPDLLVSYEKLICSPDNIFRYELLLKPDPAGGEDANALSVTVDDLKNGVRFRKEQKVKGETVRDLAAKLAETDFMGLGEQAAGLTGKDGVDRKNTLAIANGSKFNQVRVANNFLPYSFQAASDIVETFAQEQVNVLAIQLPPEKRFKEAESFHAAARRLYDNREASPDNLAKAISRFAAVVDLLDVFDPKPEMYYNALAAMKKAQGELDKAVSEHDFNARKAYNTKDIEAARNEFHLITQMLDDVDDRRYQAARANVLKIDATLKQRKK